MESTRTNRLALTRYIDGWTPALNHVKPNHERFWVKCAQTHIWLGYWYWLSKENFFLFLPPSRNSRIIWEVGNLPPTTSPSLSHSAGRLITLLLANTDISIQNIAGKENIVTNALSWVETQETPSINNSAVTGAQLVYKELNALIEYGAALKLERVPIPGVDVAINCDTSTKVDRPYITQDFRKKVFVLGHRIAHHGARSTVKPATQRFISLRIKADCPEWTRACLVCQQSKVSRHVKAWRALFNSLLHTANMFTPILLHFRIRKERDAAYRASTATLDGCIFYEGRICRFDTSLRVTTNQGRQFESYTYDSLPPQSKWLSQS